jgi:hypothetical protein
MSDTIVPETPPAPVPPAEVFAALAAYEASFDASHRAGTISLSSLRRIFELIGSSFARTAETGCGKSTILFSNFSRDHQAFAMDDRAHERSSVAYFERCPAARPAAVRFIFGPTQKTVATTTFKRPLDVVLLDGPHGYPFVDLEYYYFYPHLKPGGYLLLDDIHIASIARMADILAEDAMYEVVEVVEHKTLILRRTKAPMVGPYADSWGAQDYNRRRAAWAPGVFLDDGKKRPSFAMAAENYGKPVRASPKSDGEG